ncbi:MAG: hypothetical protein ACJ0HI_02340 [Gammaproteobacteria bacterium]
MSNKDKYKIVASLNYLKNDFFPQVKDVCPHLEERHEPAAFYFEVI